MAAQLGRRQGRDEHQVQQLDDREDDREHQHDDTEECLALADQHLDRRDQRIFAGQEHELGELDDGQADAERQAHAGADNRQAQQKTPATEPHGLPTSSHVSGMVALRRSAVTQGSPHGKTRAGPSPMVALASGSPEACQRAKERGRQTTAILGNNPAAFRRPRAAAAVPRVQRHRQRAFGPTRRVLAAGLSSLRTSGGCAPKGCGKRRCRRASVPGVATHAQPRSPAPASERASLATTLRTESELYLLPGRHRLSGEISLIFAANFACAAGSTGRCLTIVLAGSLPRKLSPFQFVAGRIGRVAKPPPQLGQTSPSTLSTQSAQNVHS